jgi:hypothetical protein
MAQFSALEQMMNLNVTFERTQAFGMIGKVICAEFFCPVREERIEIESQLVTSVTRQGSRVYLTVIGENGQPIDVPFDAVREVSEDFFLSHQLNEIFSQVQGQRATDLIGQYVLGISMMGERAEFVEGRVDSVTMQGDTAILVVGNRELAFPRDVFSASYRMRLVGSDAFMASGGDGSNRLTVESVDIVNNNRAYLVFDNGVRSHVQVINQVTTALTFIGEEISFTNIQGTAETISMVGGIPFLNVRTAEGNLRQVDFLAYLVERGTIAPPSAGNNTNNDTADADGEDA